MKSIQRKLLWILCAAITAIVLVVDISLPLGVAGGVPYIIVILMTLYDSGRKSTLAFAFFTTVLTVLGIYVSPTGGELWKVMANRLLALLAIWVTAIMVLLRKKSEHRIKAINAQLERRIAERTRELEAAHQKLVKEHRLVVLGELTATVSHELRNPLAAINTTLYALKKRSDASDCKLMSTIERIARNAERCDTIIDELLDFSKIRALKLEELDIDAWLEKTVREQQISNNISLMLEQNLDHYRCSIDSNRMRRAIINLLDNASQAMLENWSSHSKPEIVISTAKTNDRIEIVMQDNGPGISAENMEKIFEPLFSTKSFGVGLGMPAVRRIMQEHAGDIEVESRFGEGTRMMLWLPLIR